MRVRKAVGIGVAAVVLVAASGGVALYAMFGGEDPAEVSLSPTGSPAAADSVEGTFDGDFTGSWVVDTDSGQFEDFTSSFAGYRVQEELGSIGANTAVGRTPDVSGTLEVDGTTITSLSVTVDMTTLTSDEDRRDNAIRTRGLETATYPTATFELAEPLDIETEPAAGDTVEVQAVGDLTLHGVTQRVTIPIEATWTGEMIEAVASFDVALADYGIDPPTGFLVLSIADQGRIELHLLLREA